jgi:MFS family permease
VSASSSPTAARAGFRGPWIIAVSFAAQAVAIGPAFGLFSLLVKPIVDEFGATYAQVSLGLSLLMLSMAAGGMAVGALLDRRGVRGILIAGALGASASFFLLSRATELWQLGLLFGLGVGGSAAMLGILPSSALVSRWYVRSRGRALGIANMGPPAGAVLFAVAGGALLTSVGWRETLALVALVPLLLLPALALVVADRPESVGQQPDGGSAAPAAAAGAHEPIAAAWSARGLLGNRDFWGASLAMGIVGGGLGAGWSAQVVPFAADLGIPAEQGAVAVALGAGLAVPGTLLSGALSDRIEHRRLFFGLIGVLAAAFGLLFAAPSHASLLVASALFGLASGGVLPVFNALMVRTFGAASFGTALGISGLVQLPFPFSGPVVAGALRDASGSYASTFLLFLASLAAAAAILWLVRGAGGERR